MEGFEAFSMGTFTLQVKEYDCEEFKCLGGFKNVRHVYNWNEHKIELDETQVRWPLDILATIRLLTSPQLRLKCISARQLSRQCCGHCKNGGQGLSGSLDNGHFCSSFN